jgi:tRNA isopentenyl-2-thiomethyl-A-37 hydroxylase MiaE
MVEINLIVRLELSKELSKAIEQALKPDNINFPDELSIEIHNNDSLKIIFRCNDTNKIRSMRSIINEVLEHISLIIDTVGELND